MKLSLAAILTLIFGLTFLSSCHDDECLPPPCVAPSSEWFGEVFVELCRDPFGDCFSDGELAVIVVEVKWEMGGSLFRADTIYSPADHPKEFELGFNSDYPFFAEDFMNEFEPDFYFDFYLPQVEERFTLRNFEFTMGSEDDICRCPEYSIDGLSVNGTAVQLDPFTRQILLDRSFL